MYMYIYIYVYVIIYTYIYIYIHMGPPNLHFLEVFMVKNLVFRWPTPLIVLWVKSWEPHGSPLAPLAPLARGSRWLGGLGNRRFQPEAGGLGFQDFFCEWAMKTMEINFGLFIFADLDPWHLIQIFEQLRDSWMARSFGLDTFLVIPSLKLTVRTWKWIVGRLSRFLLRWPIFRGELLVSGRLNNYFK